MGLSSAGGVTDKTRMAIPRVVKTLYKDSSYKKYFGRDGSVSGGIFRNRA